MLADVRMDEVVAVLGKMSQYRVAALFIALDDLEAVGEGMAVLVRLQLLGQVVVVETPVTVVPQFYGSLVYPYVGRQFCRVRTSSFVRIPVSITYLLGFFFE